MKEIIVVSQAELDALSTDIDGRIIIKFGTPYNCAIVNRRFKCSVVAWGNSSVEAWGNSSVEARENSSVVAVENSSVVAWGNSSVVASGNSSVVARGNSSVVARGNSSVVAVGNSSVEARENSSVEAWENSSVEARGNSSVEARENSSVVASGNTQVVDVTKKHNIKVTGNARIVYNPRNIEEFLEYYDIPHSDGKVLLYKAVHKRKNRYFSDIDKMFEYIIGEESVADSLDSYSSEECGHGIHIAHIEWAVNYGANWPDLAILEVEAETRNIIVPINGSGKVRVDRVKTIREVPLEECGSYGKILSKMKNQKTSS